MQYCRAQNKPCRQCYGRSKVYINGVNHFTRPEYRFLIYDQLSCCVATPAIETAPPGHTVEMVTCRLPQKRKDLARERLSTGQGRIGVFQICHGKRLDLHPMHDDKKQEQSPFRKEDEKDVLSEKFVPHRSIGR